MAPWPAPEFSKGRGHTLSQRAEDWKGRTLSQPEPGMQLDTAAEGHYRYFVVPPLSLQFLIRRESASPYAWPGEHPGLPAHSASFHAHYPHSLNSGHLPRTRPCA